MPQQQYYQSGGRGGASSSSAAADAAGATLRSPKGPSPPPLHYHHRHGTNPPILEGDDDKAALEADADSRRPLTFWPLLALIYYTSSGGPFGIEPIVGSVGPLLSIVGYLVFPVVWSIPEALMTAELSSAFPECAGSVAWVTEAFGPSFGYMRGCLSWLSGVIDNAIYPVLFADYLASLYPHLADPAPRALLVLSFALAFSYMAWRGLDVAGKLAIGICAACLLPFVALCVAGAFHLDLARARTWRDDPGNLSKAEWRVYLGTLFWNLNAFDSAASFAGEVRDPGRTYPRAMLAALALIVASYLLPILIGALARTDIPYASWTDGTFTEIGRQVGGDWLAGAIVLSAAVSNVGLYLAEMSSDAFQVMGMAEMGMVPAVWGRKSRHDTPTHAIVLATVLIIGMSLASTFEEIVTTTNFLYSLAILFEIAAFLLLRLERPELPRPYKMPVGTLGAALVLLPPLVLIVIILATATPKTWLVSGGMAALGVLSYWLMEHLKARGLCEFYVSPPTPIPLSDLDAHHHTPPTPDGEGSEDEEQAEAGGHPASDEEEDDLDLSESLYPGGPRGPRPPAAVALAARLARSMSPRDVDL